MSQYKQLNEKLKPLRKQANQGTTYQLQQLPEESLIALQKALKQLDYYTLTVDGIVGSGTRKALKTFKQDHWLENPNAIGPTTIKKLMQEVGGNSQLPAFNGGSPRQVRLAIIDECKRQGLNLPEQWAYLIATTEHETGNTWKPVKEAFWKSETWRQQNLSYYPWYGRGYVQLTWKNNYAKYEQITGVPLTQDPNQAMSPSVALFTMVHGSQYGVFTGQNLPQYINANQVDFYHARQVINGLDKADKIATRAEEWLPHVKGI